MIGIGLNIKGLSSGSYAPAWTILTSGDTKYRQGISPITGLYVLDYSDDAGLTWTTLVSLDPTEDSVIIDSSHFYRHKIVGTSYHVDQTLTETGYDGTENIDWENIYHT